MKFALVRLTAALMVAPIFLSGCATASYNIQERFGIEKRDILVDRVLDVSKSQTEAKEEFADALEAFRAVIDVDAGELETLYDDLNRAYKRADAEADTVRSRIKSVKRVSRDLFREWEGELDEYFFKDRVLYLKHNLNARAIASLGTETADLESDVARLIAEMEQSIAAANAFIAEMKA